MSKLSDKIGLLLIIFIPSEFGISIILNQMGWPLSSNVALLVGLLSSTFSCLAVIYNTKNNQENIEKQLKESRINTLIQSRYQTEKLTIFKLNVFLIDTLTVYYHLKKLNEEKDNYLKPKSFLLLQYLWLVTDENFLTSLPFSLIKEIQKTIININFESPLNDKNHFECYEIMENFFKEHPTPPETSMFLVTEYYEFYKLLRDKWDLTASFQLIFCKCMEKGIEEKVLEGYFQEILDKISTNKIENLILEDEGKVFQSPFYRFKLEVIKNYKE